MSRMMDIGRKSPQRKPDDKFVTPPAIPAKEVHDEPKIDPLVTGPDLDREEFMDPPKLVEPVTTISPQPVKTRDISSYALIDESEQKTFPLAPVLAIVGAVVVVGIVYLLVFV